MPALAEQILQVVHEVSRALFVFQQKEVVPTAPANHLGRQKTSGRANQSSRLHLASCLFKGIGNLSRPGIVVIKSKEVLKVHGRAKITATQA